VDKMAIYIEENGAIFLLVDDVRLEDFVVARNTVNGMFLALFFDVLTGSVVLWWRKAS